MHFTLADVPVRTQIGTTAAERAAPQELHVTLRWETDTSVAQTSDEIGDTVDYFAVRQTVEAFGSGQEFQLVEHFLARLRAEICHEFPALKKLRIEVKKFPFTSGWVAVSD